MTTPRLVLFDIDGTMLNSAASGRDAIRTAFAEVHDALDCFDRVRFDGKTDPQIVRELFAEAGVPERATEAGTAALLDRYVVHLEQELAARQGRVVPLDGIPELLDTLEARNDVHLGLLTGNVRRGAELKLQAAGIDFHRFRLGAFGSDHHARPALPAIAVARAEALLGFRPQGHDVVIIGDTPADVTCGAEIGARAIAVATGWYSVSELHAAGAHATFDRLVDTELVVDAIISGVERPVGLRR